MILRPLLLAVAAARALAPAPAGARPADVAGWRAARWGMTEAALERAFGADLARLPGRWEYGGARATRYLADVALGAGRFRAIFQMNAETGRLQQVLLEPLRRPGQEAAFASALDALRAEYGPPDGRCETPRAGGGPLSVEYRWRFATTTVHLVFLDYYTRAMILEEPLFERDPLAADARSQPVNPRFLPRRALVRFHPTARADLAPAACRPDGR